jgi:hypothetical protein
MISTYHDYEMRNMKTKQVEEKGKPVSVLDYNQNMTGVVLRDQLLHTYLQDRKKGKR